jgi:hypothetical protein
MLPFTLAGNGLEGLTRYGDYSNDNHLKAVNAVIHSRGKPNLSVLVNSIMAKLYRGNYQGSCPKTQ